jgi:hypothetical protein
LSRNGTLWTFRLPQSSDGREAQRLEPISEVQTGANGEDVALKDKTLLVTTSKRNLELISLDDPAKPKVTGAIGSPLAADYFTGHLALAGDRLFYGSCGFSNSSVSSCQIAMFDVTDARRPALVGTTNWPTGIASLCATPRHLILAESGGVLSSSSLCVLSSDGVWSPKVCSRQPFVQRLLFGLLPMNGEDFLVMNDDTSKLFSLGRDGNLRMQPDTITGGRTGVVAHQAEQAVAVVGGDVFEQRNGAACKLLGSLQRGSHGDGHLYRGAAADSWVAIPDDERVWVYRWKAPQNIPGLKQTL